MASKFHIIYPCGDKSKLSVCEIDYDYELNDYAVASCQSFDTEEAANAYCRNLARQHNLEADISGNDYLD